MFVRKLVLLGMLLATCALAARYQPPTPELPVEVANPPVFARPDMGKLYVLSHDYDVRKPPVPSRTPPVWKTH